MIDFTGHRFAREIILICVRWYLTYPLSYRNLGEMMGERSVQVDHSHIYRWVRKFAPRLEAELRRSGNKRPVGTSWRMDEIYIKVNGHWKYLYRAVDKAGQSVDFLLTAHRDKKAARRFFHKALRQHGLPEKVTIDKSGANTAALEALQEETGATSECRVSPRDSRRVRPAAAGTRAMATTLFFAADVLRSRRRLHKAERHSAHK